MTIAEASEFWDEHQFDEFSDVVEVHDVQFALKRKKYLGIDLDLYTRITAQAKQLHLQTGWRTRCMA
ncbi:hypothetical protein U27_03191 [Candidatus Vecturithrix granuli]|uniref:Uncharacterized protein n=1 Tax=Vecturithrix granuli TaxID=1499967 RepID=A0A081BV74_VECG1|nr:hypothetical protein U27_03191 [Candidatus Vecturithrix granuli]